jgi:hypothetical protein
LSNTRVHHEDYCKDYSAESFPGILGISQVDIQLIFQVDIEPTETVGALKQKIEAEQNHPVALQKIIYSGR